MHEKKHCYLQANRVIIRCLSADKLVESDSEKLTEPKSKETFVFVLH